MCGHVAHGPAQRPAAFAAVWPAKQEMETKMTTPLEPIRRHPDGSIDFDRYRADIHAVRHQAMQDASKLGAAMTFAAVIAMMLIAIAVAPSKSPDASCQTCTKAGRVTASQNAAALPRLF